MGLSLKKIARGVKKIAKKNAKGVGKLAKKFGPGLVLNAVLPTAAPLIAAAASKAKTAGKKFKGLETPKSLVDVVKLSDARVTKSRSKMPGGAPMPTIGRPSVSLMSSRPQAKRKLYDRPARQGRSKRGKKIEYQTSADIKAGGFATPNAFKKAKAKRKITKPPSAKQIAARERFKKMVAARRKAS